MEGNHLNNSFSIEYFKIVSVNSHTTMLEAKQSITIILPAGQHVNLNAGDKVEIADAILSSCLTFPTPQETTIYDRMGFKNENS